MGSFSGNVAQVANTRIFARVTPEGTQYLVYQMDYAADNDLALVLPLPTPPNTTADAVRFIDLSGYPEFFEDIEKGFPYTRSVAGGARRHAPQGQEAAYQTSFLPGLDEMANLDQANRIETDAWKQLPEYSDFGFAIFRLRADRRINHPLAVEFPVRNSNLLYFPTVHIRNNSVAEEANFDHDLYCQARAGWLRSYDGAGSFMDMERAGGVIDPNERISRMTVQGLHPNSDIIVGLKA